MRVLILSKASIVGQYQTKLTTLAAKSGIELTVVVPPSWKDERGVIPLEQKHTTGYHLIVAPIRFNGHFHLHYYPTLPEILTRVQPDILHLDEEPYNFATYHAARHMRRLNSKAWASTPTHILFFSWQNILRQYPPPSPSLNNTFSDSPTPPSQATAKPRKIYVPKDSPNPSA